MKISVTWLTSYLYCRRKFYIENVLGISEPPKDVLIKGKIRHDVFDLANKQERGIIFSIDSAVKSSIFEKYKNAYLKNLKNTILIHKPTLKSLNLDLKQVFKELWPLFVNESIARSNNVFKFAENTGLRGKELWEALTPKIESELYVESDNIGLKGKVDRVEKYEDKVIPIELKTGSAPREGVWEGHLIQVAAYILLLEEKFSMQIDYGKVVYLNEGIARTIRINPSLKDEIVKLTAEVKDVIEKKQMPDFTSNRNKCESCGLRKECFNL
ncbi:CRISPR-associated protein Cas4 [Candidatus Woesearchaeota archaeon]|nr:CRISPR-associated protein Cas4 [Candidatus Woesearchaeota archaeon]